MSTVSARKWEAVEKEIFSPARIAANKAEGHRLASLPELRKALHVTQIQLASELEITQGALSQLERRGDAKVSMVRDYVAGLGGKLHLVAEFKPGIFTSIELPKSNKKTKASKAASKR